MTEKKPDAEMGEAPPRFSSHEFKDAIVCVTCNAVYFDQRWHQLEEHFPGDCVKPESCEGVLHHTISRGAYRAPRWAERPRLSALRRSRQMNLMSDEKMDRLVDAIMAGTSRSQMAKHAGVSERTAVIYRHIAEEQEWDIPTTCGCGRPIRHQGRCKWRRNVRNKR